MELYILNSEFQQETIIDAFESLIWTERYDAYGDFELVTYVDETSVQNLFQGNFLGLSRSTRIMVVEHLERVITEDGSQRLNVKGRSFESLLQKRPAGNRVKVSNAINANVPYIMEYVVSKVVDEDNISPPYSDYDIIPGLRVDALPRGSLVDDRPVQVIRWPFKYDIDMYTDLKNFCEAYSVGFRIQYYEGGGEDDLLRFDCIIGENRTTLQEENDPVIFGLEFGTLQNISELVSTADDYNVAYVRVDDEFREVIKEGLETSDVLGLDRRVLMVQATPDSDVTPGELQDFMEQQGQEALAQHSTVYIMDGQVQGSSRYTYGVDYNLGDVVDVVGLDGKVAYRRVTEQIFVQDSTGTREYPTLAEGAFVPYKTWYQGHTDNLTWSDYTDEVWDDDPLPPEIELL